MSGMSITGLDDTIDWYNSHAEQYAEASAEYYDMSHISNFKNRLSNGASVLDAGCGSGRDANILNEQGLNVTGLDLSNGLLKVARRKYPKVNFVEGNLLSLQFDDESFEGVWSNASLLHLETIHDVKQAIAEFARVLKHSGTLHVVVKSQTGDSKTAVVSDKLSGDDRFFQYFELDEITSFLENAGFSILQRKEYSEIETIPQGRPEVLLIYCLACKD